MTRQHMIEIQSHFKSGDKVKVISDRNGHGIAKDTLLTLQKVCKSGSVIYDHLGKGWYSEEYPHTNIREADFELVTDTVDVIVTSFSTTDSFESNTTKEEVNMSTQTNRKTVSVNLIDRDSALDDKYSLVANFGEFTTTQSPEALIRSIIMDSKNNVAGLITQHNEVRITQANKEILNRTGISVKLLPVEESDLYWEIK